MKPLNSSEQSRRILRWIRYGSGVGFVLGLARMIVLDDDTSFAWTDSDALGLNAFHFALIIFLAGSAGGMLAMVVNWTKRG